MNSRCSVHSMMTAKCFLLPGKECPVATLHWGKIKTSPFRRGESSHLDSLSVVTVHCVHTLRYFSAVTSFGSYIVLDNTPEGTLIPDTARLIFIVKWFALGFSTCPVSYP